MKSDNGLVSEKTRSTEEQLALAVSEVERLRERQKNLEHDLHEEGREFQEYVDYAEKQMTLLKNLAAVDFVMSVVAYEPTTGQAVGGRYELLHGYFIDESNRKQFLCCWMKSVGSGGNCVKITDGLRAHVTYVQEKMNIRSSVDAQAITDFINSVNFAGPNNGNQ